MNSLLERLRFSRIIFRPGAKNVVCKALAHEKQRKQSAWKSYARKSASIAAKHLRCSEKFLEKGEKYSEKRQEQVQTSTSPKCTFSSEVVAIDLKRFADSGIALVECPHCSRTRSLSPVKGVLRFPSHDRRKVQTPVTSKRWSATGTTDWDVVAG